tara:strand:+ start:171 stop:908 length:738 start_codon:yes stop_codon:yes gene_type:complete
MNILITGCNGLIGRTLVEYFTEKSKFKVFGVDITNNSSYKHKNFQYYKVDVSSLKEVKNLCKKFDSKKIFIEGLINSHQYKPKGFLEADIFNMDPSIWNSIVEVNLSGTYYTCREFGKKMKDNNFGVIVNFASTYAVVSSNPSLYSNNSMGNPIAYSASKGGVIALTRYLAANLAKYGIRANSITPHGVLNNHEEKFINKFKSMTPINRMMNSNEIIGPVELLLTNKGSYINGTNLIVDGGWTAW